ncbi:MULTISPECIES: hypothetical protein [Mycetohabitans]|uniref:hypothetical protein n=1 Tax=Mycetohabitans TaxID=2571159 RepID=UPI001F3EEEF1|nr:hypothetical protein [Mycetohabitans sp. B3]MCF2133891.1 hypothetical protein [Mycetohabitans sp. B3]
METWNKRLALALRQSGLSANAAAKKAKVSAPTFSAWIAAGNISPAKDIRADNLLTVCEVLDVRPEWVVFGRLPMRRGDKWPFEGINREEFEALPVREKARITRFIRDTIDDWNEAQMMREDRMVR